MTLARRGEQAAGTLHLTPHHLIFVQSPPTSAAPDAKPSKPREVWITYPIIAFCTFRPAAPASRQPSSIRLRCRDFTFVCFYFQDDKKARDVYDSIRAWTCKLGRIEKLYAFSYQPQGPEKDIVPSGWSVYDPMREWRRMGIGEGEKNNTWRISSINTDYQVRWSKDAIQVADTHSSHPLILPSSPFRPPYQITRSNMLVPTGREPVYLFSRTYIRSTTAPSLDHRSPWWECVATEAYKTKSSWLLSSPPLVLSDLFRQ